MAERIWQKSYTEGIPFEIDTSDCQSINELFSRAVADLGDRLESIDVNPLAVLESGRGCVMLDAVVVMR